MFASAGSSFLMIALTIWISVAIGPWWISIILLPISLFLDILHNYLVKKQLANYNEQVKNLFKSFNGPMNKPTTLH